MDARKAISAAKAELRSVPRACSLAPPRLERFAQSIMESPEHYGPAKARAVALIREAEGAVFRAWMDSAVSTFEACAAGLRILRGAR